MEPMPIICSGGKAMLSSVRWINPSVSTTVAAQSRSRPCPLPTNVQFLTWSKNRPMDVRHLIITHTTSYDS